MSVVKDHFHMLYERRIKALEATLKDAIGCFEALATDDINVTPEEFQEYAGKWKRLLETCHCGDDAITARFDRKSKGPGKIVRLKVCGICHKKLPVPKLDAP